LFELGEVLNGYYYTLYSPKVFLYNCLYNFGRIFDTILLLVTLFSTPVVASPDWWADIGDGLGSILNYFLNYPDDIDRYEVDGGTQARGHSFILPKGSDGLFKEIFSKVKALLFKKGADNQHQETKWTISKDF